VVVLIINETIIIVIIIIIIIKINYNNNNNGTISKSGYDHMRFTKLFIKLFTNKKN